MGGLDYPLLHREAQPFERAATLWEQQRGLVSGDY